MAKSIYDIIKKQNGEQFARTLRDNNLLDIPDIANIVKYAGRDATGLSAYLWGLREFDTAEQDVPTADPFELLHQAGYEFVEYADTLEKQNAIKKYFRDGEKLCTFRDQHRFEKNYIVNAVKYNIDQIKPSDNPQRQDEYGTSVISIQILKSGGRISIKNRYNHTVSNPDNTFGSNPDNIILGLSAALKAYFRVDWQSTGELPEGFTLVNNQVVKYHMEANNVYFGDRCYVENGVVHEINPDHQIMLDNFVWDAKQNKLLNPANAKDAFIDAFNKETENRNVKVTGTRGNYVLSVDGVPIIETVNGQITSVNFPNVTQIGSGFLYYNTTLQSINLPNVTQIGADFLYLNHTLQSIDLPNAVTIGDSFLSNNPALQSINLPNVTCFGGNFLADNRELQSINLPNVTQIGNNFMPYNTALQSINLPNVTEIGDYFLSRNTGLESINLPLVKRLGNTFLRNNTALQSISLPNVTYIGSTFLRNNTALQSINLPNVMWIGNNFLSSNTALQSIDLPNVIEIAGLFLASNSNLSSVKIPKISAEQKHRLGIKIPVAQFQSGIKKVKDMDTQLDTPSITNNGPER